MKVFQVQIKQSHLAFIVSLVLVGCGTLFHYLQLHKHAVLHLDLAVETKGEIDVSQLFFNTGEGYNQRQSFKQPLLSDGSFHPLSYPFVFKKENDLRLDPIIGAGEIKLKNVRISFLKDTLVIGVTPDRIKALKQINLVEQIAGNIVKVVTVKESIDPSLRIIMSQDPLFFYPEVQRYLTLYLVKFILCTFILLYAVLIITA